MSRCGTQFLQVTSWPLDFMRVARSPAFMFFSALFCEKVYYAGCFPVWASANFPAWLGKLTSHCQLSRCINRLVYVFSYIGIVPKLLCPITWVESRGGEPPPGHTGCHPKGERPHSNSARLGGDACRGQHCPVPEQGGRG